MRHTVLALMSIVAFGSQVVAWRSVRAQWEPASFQIIVHPENPAISVERSFLRDAFLKRVTRWPHGEVIHPVDLSFRARVREAFSEEILRRPLSALRMYWQQELFSGRAVPPPELESDGAVTSYVLGRPGGLGYVSPGAELRGARVLQVR